MRFSALALVSACALAACNPSSPTSSNPASAVFPDMNAASYRLAATIHHEDGTSMPIVMVRSGANLRMEMTAPQGETTIITNADTNESIVITTANGRTMAMRTSTEGYSTPADSWSAELAATATQTGTCNVAGESGHQWTRNDAEAETACVTNDGIILRAMEGERVVWETTSVQRGPQSADQFTAPPGVQVMDLGNMGQAMQDAMERAKAAAGQ